MPNSSARPWKMRSIRSCAGPGGGCRFAVTLEHGNDCINDLKLEAADLLDYATFQAQVLQTSGRLVRFAAVEDAPNRPSPGSISSRRRCPRKRPEAGVGVPSIAAAAALPGRRRPGDDGDRRRGLRRRTRGQGAE